MQRKRCVFNSQNQPTFSVCGFLSSQLLQSSQSDYLGSASSVIRPSFLTSTNRSDTSVFSLSDKFLQAFTAARSFKQSSFRSSILNKKILRADFVFSSGHILTSQSIRYTSTSTAGQSEIGRGSDGKEHHLSQQRKEASPEECDQAVEGLSTVKAKAKAKQIQDSQKNAKTVIMTVWAKLLGIGPALKAIALMSRFETYILNMCAYYAYLIHLLIFDISGKTGLRS